MKKKVLIINPANFYNYIIHNTEFFGDVQIEILNIEINLEAIQNSSINFNFFDCVYYDDFNNFENFSFFLKHLNFADKKKVSVFSLLIQFENFYQKSAIFKVNNEIFFPDYIVSLNENKGINLLLRVADILFVIILSPLVIFTLMFSILLLKIFSNGPVLFRQIRVRKNGKPFAIYKLRTMYVSSNEDFTKFNDDRIFPLGKYFRKLKIDELPQLFNIIKGDMSFIGPRPERFDIYNKICENNPLFSKRLIVRPGLTGLAQIHNPIATPNDSFEKLQFDVYYIKNSSIKMFFIIFINTIKIILQKKSL